MINLPAILDKMTTLSDKTCKVVFHTQELTPDQFGKIGENLQAYGYLAFDKNVFTNDFLEQMKSVKVDFDDQTKTPSQRLRGVLFVLWRQEPKGYEVFNDFYNYHMEKIINHIKNKLQ